MEKSVVRDLAFVKSKVILKSDFTFHVKFNGVISAPMLSVNVTVHVFDLP